MSTDHDLDFSLRKVPETWQEAAAAAPRSSGGPLARQRGHYFKLPTAESADLFAGSLAGLVVSLAIGVGWYYLESRGVLLVPWMAILLGAALAVAIRVGAGPADPGTRSVLALLLYLVTSCTVIVLVARAVFAGSYGSAIDLVDFEQLLLHSRFAEPIPVLCWVLGAIATLGLSSRLSR